MELNLKEWRNQQESEQKHETEKQDSVLPLFVVTEQQQISNKLNRMASYFSMAQWQELELQALIYRYMLAGADVPAELLYPIKKSLFNSSQFYLHHYPHYQPTLLQPGYWGRGAMDPEPGRCRRTDGKKWRCSRDVVAAHKYCERHMHRGRNRSRKPVEIPTHSVSSIGGGAASSRGSFGSSSPLCGDNKMSDLSHFALAGPSSSIDHQRYSGSMTHEKSIFSPENDNRSPANDTSDGHVLRCFFDDWPRSLQDHETVTSSNVRATTSTDISLKLSTGDYSDTIERSQLNWASSWGAPPVEVTQMGGPLAEALRSSVSNSNSTTSPNSVLHELQRGSVSKAISYVST